MGSVTCPTVRGLTRSAPYCAWLGGSDARYARGSAAAGFPSAAAAPIDGAAAGRSYVNIDVITPAHDRIAALVIQRDEVVVRLRHVDNAPSAHIARR